MYLYDARSESYDLGDLVEFGFGLGSLRRIQGLLQQQRQTLGVHVGLRLVKIRLEELKSKQKFKLFTKVVLESTQSKFQVYIPTV